MITDFFHYYDEYLPKNRHIPTYLTSKMDIVEVIREYINLEEYETNFYIGFCPFKNHDQKKIIVNANKKKFGCTECHNYGNIFSFIKQIKNISYYDSINLLVEKYKDNFGLRYIIATEAYIRGNGFQYKLLSIPVTKMIHKSPDIRKDMPRNSDTILSMHKYGK